MVFAALREAAARGPSRPRGSNRLIKPCKTNRQAVGALRTKFFQQE